MPKKALKKIHVNQHHIRANTKNGNTNLPIYTIKFKGKTYTCDQFQTVGNLLSRYEPDNPLSCGARCWLETKDPVALYNKQSDGTEKMVVI